MTVPLFDLTRQHAAVAHKLDAAFQRVLASGQLILGEEVRQFEREFGSYLGVEHFISCANGTDALELALEALGVQPGDEVIVPVLGWISAALAVKRRGATPVFADVLADGNMDPVATRSLMTSNTRGIVVIHLCGLPANVGAFRQMADQARLWLIEDCAQAAGAEYEGQKVGTFGDLSIFSFYPTKNLGALGDAGGIATNRADLAIQLAAQRDYGRVSRNSFTTAGRNSRMDELQAAWLREKLPLLEGWNARRRQIASLYKGALGGQEAEASIYYRYFHHTPNAAHVRAQLTQAGIGTDDLTAHFAPSHALFGCGQPNQWPVASKLVSEIVCLPMFPELTPLEIDYVIENVQKASK